MENLGLNLEEFYAELCEKYGKENVGWFYNPIFDEEDFDDDKCTCNEEDIKVGKVVNYDSFCAYCQGEMCGEQKYIFIEGDVDLKEVALFLMEKNITFKFFTREAETIARCVCVSRTTIFND
jgi:hypothetical protein